MSESFTRQIQEQLTDSMSESFTRQIQEQLTDSMSESFTRQIQEQLTDFMSESLTHLLDGFVQNSAVKIITLTQALNIFSLMHYKYFTQGRG